MRLGRRGFLGAVGAALVSAFTPPATKRLRGNDAIRVKVVAGGASGGPASYEKRIASYGNLVGEPGPNWVIMAW